MRNKRKLLYADLNLEQRQCCYQMLKTPRLLDPVLTPAAAQEIFEHCYNKLSLETNILLDLEQWELLLEILNDELEFRNENNAGPLKERVMIQKLIEELERHR